MTDEQPVLDTYSASIQNKTYIPPVGTLHIGSKWYDVDTTKLTSVKYIAALFDAMGLKVSETNENFDKSQTSPYHPRATQNSG